MLVSFVASCSRKNDEVTTKEITPVPGNYQVEVVPGMGEVLPQYDPGGGGWESEQWSADISVQLKEMFRFLLAGGDWQAAAQAMCADDFIGATLSVSNKGAPAREKRTGVVDQPSDLIASPLFSQALEGVIDRAGLAEGLERAKAKVVGIRADKDGRISCEMLFHFSGMHGHEARDLKGQWRSLWQLESGSPRLLSIEGDGHLTISAIGRFSDVTQAALGSTPSFAGQFYRGQDHWTGQIEMLTGIDISGWQGLAAADVNGDGRDDIYVAQPGGLPNRLYVQGQDGTFTDRSSAAGVDFLDSSHANLLVDLDNDGDQDLIVGLSEGIVVMENDGSGNFRKRAAKILPAAIPYSIAAADHDRDGDLDFFVCCY